jgi:hypothetical protein
MQYGETPAKTLIIPLMQAHCCQPHMTHGGSRLHQGRVVFAQWMD